jgi:competence protein ComEA
MLALVAVAVIALACSGAWVLSARPRAAASMPVLRTSAPATSSVAGGSLVDASRAAAPSAGAAAAAASGGGSVSSVGGSAGASSQIVVDVVGKVRRPGVYRLAAGSRVVDAVAAAGGATPGLDLTSVNLARRVADGEQVAIGVPPTAEASSNAGGAGGTASGTTSDSAGAGGTGTSPVDLNTATLGQLDGLPGVGPVLAQRILDWRAAHGRFAAVADLRKVTGIGDAKFADLAPLVVVS